MSWTKRVLLFGAVAGGVIYCGWKGYLMMPMFDSSRKSNDEELRRREHYIRIQQNCIITVSKLLTPLKEFISNAQNTNFITTQLKQDPENKRELWETLKTTSFSRAVVSACVSGMLVLLVRIQFSVLAAYMYLDKTKINGDIQKLYLSTSHQTLEKGLSILVQAMNEAAEQVLKDYSFKHPVTVETIQLLLTNIIDKASERHQFGEYYWLLQYMLPSESTLGNGDGLSDLMTTTQDVLELEDTQKILQALVERALLQVSRSCTESFHSAAQSSTSLPLARVVPILSDNSLLILQPQRQRALLQEMVNRDELTTLSENIYEAFSRTC